MVVISEEYQLLNNLYHFQNEHYGASGFRWYKWVLKYSPTEDILDYGCGKGTLAHNLPFPIAEYDPAIKGKNESPEPHSFVVCTDVLEHVEPECIDDVIADLGRVTIHFGLFVISTKAAQKILPDGRNAHLIIEPLKWWRKKLEVYFDLIKIREELSQEGEIAILVRRKKCRT